MLSNGGAEQIINQSILDFMPERQWDLVFVSGVLIHINPLELGRVYDLMYHASKKYIMLSEYYNPVPVEVNYRGHDGKLFKRDFAGELWDKYPDLKLLGYGFGWHRDHARAIVPNACAKERSMNSLIDVDLKKHWTWGCALVYTAVAGVAQK